MYRFEVRMESEGVAIEFTLTQGEYRAGYYRQLRIWNVPVAIVLPIAGVVLLTLGVAYRSGLVLLLGISSFVFFALLVGRPARMPATDRGLVQTMAFNPRGVYLAGRTSETRSDWSLFKEVDEAPDFFLLKLRATNKAVVVPKRAFDSPAEIDYFRDLTDWALANA